MDTSASGSADKDDAKPTASSGKSPTRAYAPAVLEDRQPRLTDLVPQRAFVLVMLGLLGLTAIASIECVYIHLQSILSSGVRLPGLDLEQQGSVASWFSSMTLALGATASLVIYSIRVHRVDDYRGRYRVWLWTSAALVLASVHVVTGLHESVNAACLLISGIGSAGAGRFLWIAVYGTALSGLGVWLAFELWPSLEAFGLFAAAATLSVVAVVVELGLLPLQGELLSTVVGTTVVMLAHGTLVYSLLLYARHVHLDAQGRLLVAVEKAKRKKTRSSAKLAVVGSEDAAEPRRKKGASADKATSTAGKDAAAEGTAGSGAKPAGASISAATLKSPSTTKPLSVAERDEDDEDADGDKPSRAERRRLKKLAQQGDSRGEQRRAA